eukprot:scaffold100592_cov49-Attheya_sp.AAC.1
MARCSDLTWRFSDTHGDVMTMGTYVKYLSSFEGLTDDSPLAIYDAEFGDDELTAMLCDEYEPPACFGSDLFARVDHDDHSTNNNNIQKQQQRQQK